MCWCAVKKLLTHSLHLTATGNHLPYGITRCYLPPAEVTFPPLPQPKLVLDLATPKGCKAELTWMVITSPRYSAWYLRKLPTVSWPGFEHVPLHHCATVTSRPIKSYRNSRNCCRGKACSLRRIVKTHVLCEVKSSPHVHRPLGARHGNVVVVAVVGDCRYSCASVAPVNPGVITQARSNCTVIIIIIIIIII